MSEVTDFPDPEWCAVVLMAVVEELLEDKTKRERKAIVRGVTKRLRRWESLAGVVPIRDRRAMASAAEARKAVAWWVSAAKMIEGGLP